MKQSVFIFVFLLAHNISNAQSELIKNIFKLLPSSKVYNLSAGTRDSMLSGKTYYPANNDSESIMAYNYGYSEYVNDYLYISLSYETGQRGEGMIELRNFKMINGNNLILVSKTGGVWQANYQQIDLSIFIYGKDKRLISNKKKMLPAIDETIFMKNKIPPAIKKEIFINSNASFNLSHTMIMLSLNSNYLSDNKKVKKWLKGDRINFNWIKDQFVAGKIYFE